MATSNPSTSPPAALSLALIFIFYVSGALGGIICEGLDQSTCAYAVSSSNMRCVLEKDGMDRYECRTSEIEADDGLKDWIETDECIEACGLDRRTSLGISSDLLLESRFREKMCSSPCYGGCPNIVDLFFNLAAAEGVFLPKLCEAQQTNSRRTMAEIRSSGGVVHAAGPESSSSGKLQLADSPALSPLMPSSVEPPM